MTTIDHHRRPTARKPEQLTEPPIRGTRDRPRELEDVRLDRVSSVEWRVSDRRFLTEHGRAIIGVIDRVGSAYRVTTLEHPDSPALFGTLRGARNAFVERE
jgi:hypothetical protein